MHLHNHEHYHKEAYHPTIKKVHSGFHGYDEEDFDETFDKLTSTGWSDGDIQHLKAIVKDEISDQCINNKNIQYKQSA
eukprot:10021090-Ditylum_brightwellii.AAC.1